VTTRATRVLLFDQVVRIDRRDVDQYGRLVARVLARGPAGDCLAQSRSLK
jgi:endonuclease YncB( thermonuclease family)